MSAFSATSGSATERTLERVLTREAERLRVARSLPLDLEPVLADLGITLRAEAPTSPRRGHGWLQRYGSHWQIVVDASTGSARQRYTIAHELGHYVVEAWTGYRPITRRDYWMLEAACQRFAAELLAPRQAVESAMGAATPSPETVIEATDRLIAMTGLSLEAAARRVIDTAAFPVAALAFRLPNDGSPSRQFAQVLWIRSNHPWIQSARGRLIRKDHPLRAAARASASLDPGESGALDLPGATSSLMARRQGGLVLIGAMLERRATS
jgi:IrrE N-terminal-like domain